jgi:hypothetical protein
MEHPRLQLMGWKRRVLEVYAAARADGDLGTDGRRAPRLGPQRRLRPVVLVRTAVELPLAPPENRPDVAVEAGERTARWY